MNKNKDKFISFRVSEEDEQEIIAKAKEANISVSTFCRRKAKGIVVKAPSPLAPISDKELVVYAKQIASTLKNMSKAGQGVDIETYDSLRTLIKRITNRLNNVS